MRTIGVLHSLLFLTVANVTVLKISEVCPTVAILIYEDDVGVSANLAKPEPVSAVQRAFRAHFRMKAPRRVDVCGILRTQARTRSTVGSGREDGPGLLALKDTLSARMSCTVSVDTRLCDFV
jgi:hypothetical protein